MLPLPKRPGALFKILNTIQPLPSNDFQPFNSVTNLIQVSASFGEKIEFFICFVVLKFPAHTPSNFKPLNSCLPTKNFLTFLTNYMFPMDDFPFRQTFELGTVINTAEKSMLNLVKL